MDDMFSPLGHAIKTEPVDAADGLVIACGGSQGAHNETHGPPAAVISKQSRDDSDFSDSEPSLVIASFQTPTKFSTSAQSNPSTAGPRPGCSKYDPTSVAIPLGKPKAATNLTSKPNTQHHSQQASHSSFIASSSTASSSRESSPRKDDKTDGCDQCTYYKLQSSRLVIRNKKLQAERDNYCLADDEKFRKIKELKAKLKSGRFSPVSDDSEQSHDRDIHKDCVLEQEHLQMKIKVLERRLKESENKLTESEAKLKERDLKIISLEDQLVVALREAVQAAAASCIPAVSKTPEPPTLPDSSNTTDSPLRNEQPKSRRDVAATCGTNNDMPSTSKQSETENDESSDESETETAPSQEPLQSDMDETADTQDTQETVDLEDCDVDTSRQSTSSPTHTSSPTKEAEEDKKKEEEEDDAVCDYCGGGWPEEENEIVFCDGCKKGVHQYCYSGFKLPPADEDWFCDTCLAREEYKERGNKTKKGKDISFDCPLCPLHKPSPMRRLKKEWTNPRNGKTHAWVHSLCSKYFPTLSMADPVKMDLIVGLKDLDPKHFQFDCRICDVKNEGACTQCNYNGEFGGAKANTTRIKRALRAVPMNRSERDSRCIRPYHPGCAKNSPDVFMFNIERDSTEAFNEDGTPERVVMFHLYCWPHLSAARLKFLEAEADPKIDMMVLGYYANRELPFPRDDKKGKQVKLKKEEKEDEEEEDDEEDEEEEAVKRKRRRSPRKSPKKRRKKRYS